jgi:hypothetical protein
MHFSQLAEEEHVLFQVLLVVEKLVFPKLYQNIQTLKLLFMLVAVKEEMKWLKS